MFFERLKQLDVVQEKWTWAKSRREPRISTSTRDWTWAKSRREPRISVKYKNWDNLYTLYNNIVCAFFGIVPQEVFRRAETPSAKCRYAAVSA